ncbi:MAG: DMT family transporter [Prevotella sp.]|nr:DMT family transporter [Prevotella sp.]MBR1621779.1 DMT family transporter [Prevotella sp.]
MQYIGELISIGVAVSWTVAALGSEIGSRKVGVVAMNAWRLGVAFVLSGVLMWFVFGSLLPQYASSGTVMVLLLSGVVGFFFGDWCLFKSYMVIGSRFGMLFMAMAPMFTALFAWMILGQELGWRPLLAMAVTLTGISVVVLGRGKDHHLELQLPFKGILFGIGASVGQGLGLVLSKIGLDGYEHDVPQELLPNVVDMLPFAANMIRCFAGFVCFALLLVVRRQTDIIRTSSRDTRFLLIMLMVVFTGPFIGVGFSLMAIQYTAAGIASTIQATTPILILVPTYYLFHQPITARSVIGAVVSVIGVSLFFLL